MIRYIAAVGSPSHHSGIECNIKCELQIGDYINIDDEEKEKDYLCIVKSRYYCTVDHILFFFLWNFK